MARERDRKAMEAWRDHPYVDIIDNRSDFDAKIDRLIDLVVRRIGINVGDRYDFVNKIIEAKNVRPSPLKLVRTHL